MNSINMHDVTFVKISRWEKRGYYRVKHIVVTSNGEDTDIALFEKE